MRRCACVAWGQAACGGVSARDGFGGVVRLRFALLTPPPGAGVGSNASTALGVRGRSVGGTPTWRPHRACAGLCRARAHEAAASSRQPRDKTVRSAPEIALSGARSSFTPRAKSAALRPRALGGVCCDGARDEARLARWLEAADRLGPERRADRLARQGAETGTTEVAVAAGWSGTFAHVGVCSGARVARPRSDDRGRSRRSQALSRTKTDEIPPVSRRPKSTTSIAPGAALPGRATPGRTTAPG